MIQRPARLCAWLPMALLLAGIPVLAETAAESIRLELAAEDARMLAKARNWLAARPAPDTTHWSEKRIAAYRAERSDLEGMRLPEGLLRIPAADIELPVFAGTEERHLTLGAGRIEGTPPIGTGGNAALAAHRDGYFRALQNVALGDRLLVETLDTDLEYRIVDLFVVDPQDIYVLDPTEVDTITIVTCYPFYYVGPAPQRYIVRAELQ